MALVIAGFFLLPLSYHNFIVKASSILFYAETKDDTLFCSDKGEASQRRNSRVAVTEEENEAI